MKQIYSTFYFCMLNLFLISLNCTSQTKIELIDYSSSECQEGIYYPNLHKLQNRIIEINKSSDFQTYNIFVVANCNRTEKGKIELRNDTLNLSFHGLRKYQVHKEKVNDSIEVVNEKWVEEFADCDCAFNISYKIKGLKNKNYVVTVNGKKIIESDHKFKIRKKKPSFEIFDNDTINYVDIYGLKQGVHILNTKDGRLLSRIEYVDDEKISGLSISYSYSGFDKVETYMENRKYTLRKFYIGSKLIKTCETDGFYEEQTNCKYEK